MPRKLAIFLSLIFTFAFYTPVMADDISNPTFTCGGFEPPWKMDIKGKHAKGSFDDDKHITYSIAEPTIPVNRAEGWTYWYELKNTTQTASMVITLGDQCNDDAPEDNQEDYLYNALIYNHLPNGKVQLYSGCCRKLP